MPPQGKLDNNVSRLQSSRQHAFPLEGRARQQYQAEHMDAAMDQSSRSRQEAGGRVMEDCAALLYPPCHLRCQYPEPDAQGAGVLTQV